MSALTAGQRPVVGERSSGVSVNDELKSLYGTVSFSVYKIC